jgi:type II secretory pathway pseudopilin PulG
MRLKRKNNVITRKRQDGFSAIELLISMFLITAILAVAVAGMRDMQRRNFSETSRVDTVQETRDFIDQVVRDVHNVGYPPGRAINGNPTCVNNAAVSCGVITFSPLQVIYEGDLDGTGTVSQIWLLLAPGPGNRCPCILQRGVITKAAALGGAVPQYFTEVNGVLNSGNGANASTYPVNLGGIGNYAAYGTADVFSAYDVNGAQIVANCATAVACSNIRSLQVTANVAPTYSDPTTKLFPVFSITSKARLNF